jgi:long-chain acyl-CoA synthetase
MMLQVWSWSVQKYGGKKLLGTREIIGEEDEVQPNGQVFRLVIAFQSDLNSD